MKTNRTFLVISLVFLGLVMAGVILASHQILLPQFAQAEKDQLTQSLSQAQAAIHTQAKALDALAADWGAWDEPTDYARDQTIDFAGRNLTPESLKTADIDMVAVFDTNGHLLTTRDLGESGDQYLDRLPTSLSTYLSDHPDTLSITDLSVKKSGILFQSSTPLLVSIVPLIGTQRTGPITGTMIMGKYLTPARMQTLRESTLLDISIVPLKQPVTNYIDTTSAKTATITSAFASLSNHDYFGLQVKVSRELYQNGQDVVRGYILTIILAVACFIVINYLILNRFLLDPQAQITSQIADIARTGSFSRRLTVGPLTTQELQRGIDTINQLLTTIESLQFKQAQQEGVLKSQLELVESKNLENENIKKAIMNILEDQKLLDEKLQSEQYRLNSIINSMGEGLMVINKDRCIDIINPSACLLLETTEKDAIGKDWSQLVKARNAQGEIDVSQRSFSEVINTGVSKITSARDNHSYQTKSGKIFPVASTTTALKDKSGQVIGAIKVFRDITQEKEEREIIENEVAARTRELNAEKARLSATLNSLSQGFALFEPTGQTIFVNPAFIQLCKLPTPPKHINEFVQAFTAAITPAQIQQGFSGVLVSIPEYDLGTTVLRLTIVPVFSNSIQIGLAILVEDITEQKQLNRSRDEFFSIASHELRTPLTAIRGNTSMIMDYYNDKLSDAALREMVNDIHESSVRLIGIVGDFLDISRLEQGRLVIKKAEVNVETLVTSVINELKPAATSKGLELISPPALPTPLLIQTDPDRCKQIVLILIDNAIKYTESGHVAVSITPGDHTVTISVSDTGRGIAPSQQGLLFKKFQQAGKNLYTRDATKGTGLGLYISKLLAESLGGKVALESSAENVGSTFTLTLPL